MDNAEHAHAMGWMESLCEDEGAIHLCRNLSSKKQDWLHGYYSFSATHVTLNESDASESITWLHFKLRNTHFRAHYLDSTHFSKTNGCFR